MSDVRELLRRTAEIAADYVESLDERPVFPDVTPEQLREVLERYGLERLEASERDLLHGAALEAAKLPEPVEGDAPPGAYTCC